MIGLANKGFVDQHTLTQFTCVNKQTILYRVAQTKEATIENHH